MSHRRHAFDTIRSRTPGLRVLAALTVLLSACSGSDSPTAPPVDSSETYRSLDAALSARTTYVAKIRTLDSTGAGPWAATAFTGASDTPPGETMSGRASWSARARLSAATVPPLVDFTAGDDGGPRVAVSWPATDGAAAYELEIVDDGLTLLSEVVEVGADCGPELCSVELVDKARDGENRRPIAVISLPSASGVALDDALELDGSATTDPDGTVTGYAWRLEGSAVPFSTGPVARVPALPEGDYRVHLAVTDDDGAITRASIAIDVSNRRRVATVEPRPTPAPVAAPTVATTAPAAVTTTASQTLATTAPTTVPAAASPAVAATAPAAVTATAPTTTVPTPALAAAVPETEPAMTATPSAVDNPISNEAERIVTVVIDPTPVLLPNGSDTNGGSAEPRVDTPPTKAPVSTSTRPDVETPATALVATAPDKGVPLPRVDEANTEATPDETDPTRVDLGTAEKLTAQLSTPEPSDRESVDQGPTELDSVVEEPTSEVEASPEPVEEQPAVVAEPAPDTSSEPDDADLSSPRIERVVVERIEPTSATIFWELDEYATGVVEYGETGELNRRSVEEIRFKWKAHRQTIEALSPNTRYVFVVRSRDAAGNESVSSEHDFTTPSSVASPVTTIDAVPVEEPAPQPDLGAARPTDGPDVGGWPAGADDSLPMGGVFYGTPKGGLMTGNSSIALENAIRFRAERTGTIDAIRYNNRTLTDKNIVSRCEKNGPGSDWCNCVDAGLDRYTCGYTLGNSYSVGNGGRITLEVHEDDGSSRHLPSGNPIASSREYIPMNLGKNWPTIDLLEPVSVTAGRIYHLVLRNAAPPSRCKLKRHPVDDAGSCPRNEGAVGMNGTWHGTDPSDQSRFGPFRGRQGVGSLVRQQIGGKWIERADAAPFYEVRYTDGEYVGDSYAGYDNLNSGSKTGTRTIEGNARGRQVFTVEDTTRIADGLWVQFGHVYDRAINGRALEVEVKDQWGTVLASGSFAPSQECNDIARGARPNGKRADWMCRTWGYTDLDATVSLLEGSTYSVEFSAPAGAGFDLSSYFSAGRLPERNIWENAQAEFSADGGGAWGEWGNNYQPDRDLAVLFTLEGMPKRLP